MSEEKRDAIRVFELIWENLKKDYGENNLKFPDRIIWLGGAPGAGKGTNTEIILKQASIKSRPIIISDFLKTPEAKKIMDAGGMVGDKEVVGQLLRKLNEENSEEELLIDGFPRTIGQAEILKQMYQKAAALPSRKGKPGPVFTLIDLQVPKETAIERQMGRGQKAAQHNEKVKETGEGTLVKIRKTDLDRDLAENRYNVYLETTSKAMSSLQNDFRYIAIDASGSIDEVKEQIISALK